MKNNPRIINAWCLYDWANSVHSLVIVSSIFPVYFSATALNEAGGNVIDFLGFSVKNSVLFSYSVSASFLLIALLCPISSALADYSGQKKAFMRFFCILGSISCSLLFFFTQETTTFAVFCFILSLVGWGGSIVFYNSYLPEIVTEDQIDRVSARGFTMGYIGSVLLMIFNLTMILFPQWYGGLSGSMASRISFLTVGVWWFGFAQLSFRNLPDAKRKERPKTSESWIFNGFRELKKVFDQVQRQKLLKKFLLAYFIYNMAVQTVMYIATIFGSDELKLPAQSLIVTILLIQLIAIPGAILFARLSGKLGNIYALMIAVTVWVGICVGAYFVMTEYQFYALAVVVGLVMGGIQALSRATYSKLIPSGTQDTASFFSFYDVTEKVSIVIGTLMYGLIEQLTGSMRNSVLALLVLFVAGLLLLWRIPSQKVYRVHLETEEIS
ncbi:MFS transporter [Larkinella rosea]|uniref:MFS transporter n=1 Tax=Larkinella rosea TaxID=2025312 RepID=A0A3P1C1L4_9BACT|nr:MFS transporter [Larkinella rosea]RRB07138.1 MFS transporter [Larkinella rosea]